MERKVTYLLICRSIENWFMKQNEHKVVSPTKTPFISLLTVLRS